MELCGHLQGRAAVFEHGIYAEVYEIIQKLQVAVGGMHLDVQCRPFCKTSTLAESGKTQLKK
jgi:hypothetical protein